MVLISMTFDDPEQHYALYFKIHAFSEPTTKNSNEDRLTYGSENVAQ